MQESVSEVNKWQVQSKQRNRFFTRAYLSCGTFCDCVAEAETLLGVNVGLDRLVWKNTLELIHWKRSKKASYFFLSREPSKVHLFFYEWENILLKYQHILYILIL